MSKLASGKLPLVGRETEKAILLKAVENLETVIVYLEGRAGAGKTMLLEEAERIARESAALCPPILDFYDTRTHSHQGLEAAIALSLDPQKHHFTQYWRLRELDPQADLWEPFCEGYSVVARNARIVLRFDTAERLAYERDSEEVLRDCEVEEIAAPSWQWVLQRIGELPNTAIIIAARPVGGGALRRKLKETYTNRLFEQEVASFSLPETQAYFEASEFGRQVLTDSPDIVAEVHALAEGRPILLALALDWLQRGDWDQRTLEMIRAVDFERVAVEQIRILRTPLDRAVKCTALCRKGCNAELLRRLMKAGGHEVDQEEAEQLVAQLLELSFVKPPRHGSRDMFFLHDEMYDLVEKYVWLPEWPDYREQARLDRIIIDWYAEQIQEYAKRIREAKDWQGRGQFRREQQLLIAERLYYQFDEDPRLGYREYSHLDEEAIARRELEWDTWLRNEALWFTSHRYWRRGDPNNHAPDYPRRDPAWGQNDNPVRNPTVDYDSRRHWVGRHIARNDMAKAARVADQLLAKRPLPEEPEMYRGGIRVALATAQAYMGGVYTEQALQNFDVGIRALLNVSPEHRETWLHPYLLGTTYLYKGLALRGALSLAEAAEAYAKSIHRFRQAGYQPGLAEATNNLAYVLTRQGRLEPALRMSNRAWRIRQEMGDEYGIGLSLNTRGIIHERMDHPVTAIHNSSQALDIFLDMGNERGIILARINLGRSYRRKARSLEWGQQDTDFRQGEEHLQQAIKLQNKRGASADMFYRVEALNELGCLYRDWAATLCELGLENDAVFTLLDKAEENLQQAIELTSQGSRGELAPLVVQHVDALEDLARVYYWRARLELPSPNSHPAKLMHELLERTENLARTHLEGREELRLILGKVYFQRARLTQLEKQALEKVAQYYAMAAGYAESYSVDAPEVRKFAGDASEWLSELSSREAEECIWAMVTVLHRQRLRSSRLRENVESIVRPMLDVSWPTE